MMRKWRILANFCLMVSMFVTRVNASETEETDEISQCYTQPSDDTTMIILSNLDHNDLIQFRAVSHWSAESVEKIFTQIALIKLPLYCLTRGEKKHPYPQTISYNLRNRLWQTSINDPRHQNIFQKCAEFSKTWNFPGEKVFSFKSKSKFGENGDVEKVFNPDFSKYSVNNPQDTNEVHLWCGHNLIIDQLSDKIGPKNNLLQGFYERFVESVIKIADIMPEEEKEIRNFYVHCIAKTFLKYNKILYALNCYNFLDQLNWIFQKLWNVIKN